VAVGDFNADGKLDLGVTSNVYYPGSVDAYGNWYPGVYLGGVTVLLGTGDGSFAAPTGPYPRYGYHTSAAVADFNGDGKQDFASVNNAYDLYGTSTYGAVSVLLAPALAWGLRATSAPDIIRCRWLRAT